MIRIGMKHMISVTVTAAMVLSLGCLTMADELDNSSETAVLSDGVECVIDTENASITEDPSVADEDEEVVIVSVEESVSDEASYAKNGWDEYSAGKWKYYENGTYVKGWKEIDHKWFWFSSSGVMFTGMRYDSEYKATYIFGVNGAMIANRWQQYDGNWYFLNGDGKAAKGWNRINGVWYYFVDSQNPYMYKNTIKEIGDDGWYMFDRSGAMLTGWQKTNYGWLYLDTFSGRAANGWKQIGGVWYYFDISSYGPVMVDDDIVYIPGTDGKEAWYGFDENGALMKAGWFNSYVVEIDGKKYENGNWYYFDSKGKAATGWQTIGGKKYYFGDGTTNPLAVINVNKIAGKYYYFDPNTCALFTNGWVDTMAAYSSSYSSGSMVYAGTDGVLYTGWKTIDGKKYYFGDGNSRPSMKTGFVRVDEKLYFLGDNGALQKNCIFEYEGERYMANSSGVLAEKTWITYNKKPYYFLDGGAMATGIRKIDGVMYDFGEDGVCVNPPKS